MMSKQININSVVGLRTECDDHLPITLTKLGYTQSFKMTDFKLAIGYICVAISGLLYYLEKRYDNDFHNTEYVNYTKLLVGAFFILNSIWYLFGKFVEKDTKFVGKKGSQTLEVSTKIKSKTEPIYYMTFKTNDTTSKEAVEFNTLFNSNGFLDYPVFSEKVKDFVAKLDKKSE